MVKGTDVHVASGQTGLVLSGTIFVGLCEPCYYMF